VIAAVLGAGANIALGQSVESQEFEFEKFGGIEYQQGDDYRLTLDVYVPEGDGPFPAILAVHGGSWRSGTKLNWFRHARRIARAGFVVVAINYRHAPKFQFPAQLDDCKAAVRWMRMNADTYRIDPERIGAVGYSAGGHLVALLALTAPGDGMEGDNVPAAEAGLDTRLQAAAVGGAPCDLGWIDENSEGLNYFLGGTRRELPEAWRRASPVTWATADDPPIYIFHGRDDWIVPCEVAESFHEELLATGIESEITTWENGHFGLFSRLEAFDPVIDFFRRTLGDPAATVGQGR
jgi:acetyl esterase/lipase